MKKVLITGANGYIGSQMVEFLLQKDDYEVRALVNNSVDRLAKIEKLDVRNLYSVDQLEESLQGIDTVFHFATLYDGRSDDATVKRLLSANLDFTIELADAQSKIAPNSTLVNAASFSSYGVNGEYAPTNPYSATKYAAESSLHSFPIRTVSLRLSDTYGPNDSRKKVHNLLVQGLRENNEFFFQSPDEQELRLIHVSDVVESFLAASENTMESLHSAYDLYGARIKLSDIATQALRLYPTAAIQFPLFGNITPLQVNISLFPHLSLSHDPNDDLLEVLTQEK